MNFKIMSYFIIVLGFVIIAYGGFQFVGNLPEKFNSEKSEMTVFGRNDLGNILDVQMNNIGREGERKSAVKVMIAGGVVSFIGIGIYASAKKKD